MRVLVTGGAGFIGSNITGQLRARGDEVVVIDDLSSGVAGNVPDGVRLVHADIAREGVVDVISTTGARAVVHCAAQPSVAASMRDPAADAAANIIGSINVISGAIAAGASRFVYINTGGALYGQPARIPSNEREAVRPMSPYGLSKSIVEDYLSLMAPSPGWWSSLRLANVYGPRQRAEGEAGVVISFISKMLRGLPVEIHGDGNQTRDFVYVGDVAVAVALALDQATHSILNVGTGSCISINTVFLAIAERLGYGAQPTHVPARPGDIRDSALDASRARQVLGWMPETTFEDGLDRTVAWFRAVEAVPTTANQSVADEVRR
jgi:UDP-glucose 4-epimerase